MESPLALANCGIIKGRLSFDRFGLTALARGQLRQETLAINACKIVQKGQSHQQGSHCFVGENKMQNSTFNKPPTEAACDLESVIATHELSSRKSRVSDTDAENRAVLELVSELSKSPSLFFQKLVDTALYLSVADSTGISLLDEDRKRFVWPAVAGGLTPYLGGGTPQGFGPCGTVLERNAPILFRHPERHFVYLTPIEPPLEEVLLIPFYMNGKAVGTLWAVIHVKDRQFDAEDRRLLHNLSKFAASAYGVLAQAGAIDSFLNVQMAASKSELASKT
jgi:hypothetical protein